MWCAVCDALSVDAAVFRRVLRRDSTAVNKWGTILEGQMHYRRFETLCALCYTAKSADGSGNVAPSLGQICGGTNGFLELPLPQN